MKILKSTLSAVILTGIAWMLLSSPACADYILLDNVTTTGPGPVKLTTHQGYITWTGDIDVDNSSSVVQIRIDGNIYGNRYSPKGLGGYTLDAEELAAGKASFSFSGIPINKIRAYVVAITGRIESLVCAGVDR